MMMEVLGVPAADLLDEASRRSMFFAGPEENRPKISVNSKGEKHYPGSIRLSQAIDCSDTLFLDFLRNCLEWDPKKRWNPDLAWKHKWLKGEDLQ